MIVMTIGCSSSKPRLRFYPGPVNRERLSEVLNKSSTSLRFESLAIDTEVYGIYCRFHRPPRKYGLTDFRRLSAVVRGRLPPGKLSVKAVHISEDGSRKAAYIIEPQFTCEDPRANLFAIDIIELREDRFSAPSVIPGHYYIFLEIDGKELCGGDLTISRQESMMEPQSGAARHGDFVTASRRRLQTHSQPERKPADG
jgi:hypothetical protein